MKCVRCKHNEATTTVAIEVLRYSQDKPYTEIVDEDIPVCERCNKRTQLYRQERRETLEGLVEIERDFGARR